MSDQVRAVAGGIPEASAADVQEQLQAVLEETDDVPSGFSLPDEASEADAVEQLRPAPLDEDDRR